MIDNKQRILTAASELLLEQGIGSLSVRAISQRAGLSTIAIYSHFHGKEGVLDALYIEGFEAICAAMDEAATLADARAAAHRASENYLRLAHENEAHYRLIFGQHETGFTPSDAAREKARQAFGRLVAIAARLLPESSTRRAQQQAALRIWALIHGHVSLRHHVVGDMLDYGPWRKTVLSAASDEIDRLASRA